jgi:hypothetical protein
MGADSDLATWIGVLRARLASGGLADLSPMDLFDGTAILPGELVARIMLSDLDDLDHPAGRRAGDGAKMERRHALLADFRRLRELIG